jgi:KDO2-lipid IV(A) lauroyltransferase
MNQVIEARIHTMPEQYFWVHRRFKTRPPGEAPIYPPRRRRR